MIARRRCASAMPASGSAQTPSSSGPRCRIRSAIAPAMAPSGRDAPALPTKPAMPHIDLSRPPRHAHVRRRAIALDAPDDIETMAPGPLINRGMPLGAGERGRGTAAAASGAQMVETVVAEQVAVIGLGYVGLPLAVALARHQPVDQP